MPDKLIVQPEVSDFADLIAQPWPQLSELLDFFHPSKNKLPPLTHFFYSFLYPASGKYSNDLQDRRFGQFTSKKPSNFKTKRLDKTGRLSITLLL